MFKNFFKICFCTIFFILMPVTIFAADYTLDALGNSEEAIVYKSNEEEDFDIELPRLTNRRFVEDGDSFLSENTDSKEPRVYQ